MSTNLRKFIERNSGKEVEWTRVPARRIYKATLDEVILYFRLNDFPDEPICTIMGMGEAVDLENYVKTWKLDERPQNAVGDSFEGWFTKSIGWLQMESIDVAYANVGGVEAFLRFNEWPEPNWTLIGNGTAMDFEKLPEEWTVKECDVSRH